MSKTTKDRRDEITKMVLSETEVKVSDLAKAFQVSMETIRKDLNYLDEIGMVVKTHGGAKVIHDYYQLPVDVKLQENVIAKRLIARRALDLIEDQRGIFGQRKHDDPAGKAVEDKAIADRCDQFAHCGRHCFKQQS